MARDRGAPLAVDGFDLVVVANETGSARVDEGDLRFELSRDGTAVVMRLGDEEAGRASLGDLIELAGERSRFLDRFEDLEVSRELMTVDLDGEAVAARLVLASLRLERRDGRLAATGFDLDAVLLRREARVP